MAAKKQDRSVIFRLFISGLLLVFYTNAHSQSASDYTSKVPKYSFAQKLDDQLEQLKTNPLMLRFAASRKALAADKYRPLYHFVSPESTLNDPNGLCFWKGKWHLFYQGYPPEDNRQHWGHAVSEDLIHWKDLPYAIYPDPEKAVFSGAALVEDNRVIAMYHGTEQGNMVATSDDDLLLNWKKLTNKPVIPIKSAEGRPLPYTVFDPSIWKKDGYFYSLSAGKTLNGPGGKGIRADYLFRSKDLIKWSYLHEFVEGDRFTLINDDGACPYFWPIGNRYIMPFFSHMSGGQYLLGDYDKIKDKFSVTAHGKFNFGAAHPAGVHAPSAAPDGRGGVIVILNMNPGKPTKGWNQLMTLPRRMTLLAKDEVGIEPAGSIESLRYDHQKIDSMMLPANKEIVLDAVKGNAMEIIAEIDPMKSPMIELNVLRSSGREEYTRIAFFKDRGYTTGRAYDLPVEKKPRESLICLETSYSSLLPDAASRAPEVAPVAVAPGETLKLRIFIDKSVVEVFVNGRQCIAARVYPGRDDSIGVSLRSQGQSSKLKSLEAWQMKSIYE